MDLRPAMLRQLATARRIVSDGVEVVPAWTIFTPEGDFLILTRFDPNHPGQGERALRLVSRFMAWRMATAFVMGAEFVLTDKRTPQDAIIALGVSRSKSIGALQRIEARAPLMFGEVEWLEVEAIDPTFLSLLPKRMETVTAEEARELAAIFGAAGEMPAHKIS